MESAALPAGRQLDARVAEKVFGCAIVWMDGEPYEKHPFKLRTERNPIPRFSSDLAAAWEVLDKLLERPRDVVVSVILLAPNRGVCKIERYDSKGDLRPDWDDWERGDEGPIPLVICHAALKAME